jgi:hypothetical protein
MAALAAICGDNALAQNQPLPKVETVIFTRLEGTPGNI